MSALPIVNPHDGFHFDPVAHIYTLHGVRMPSCTQILNEMVSTASYPAGGGYKERGTSVHKAICELDPYIQAGRIDLFDTKREYAAYDGYLESYVQMMRQWPFKWTHTEYVTYDPDLKVGLTIDRAGTIWDYPCVADAKTGELESPVRLQTAAAARALFGSTVAKTVKRFALKLFSDGKPGHPEEYEDPSEIDAWAGLATYYKWPYRPKNRR